MCVCISMCVCDVRMCISMCVFVHVCMMCACVYINVCVCACGVCARAGVCMHVYRCAYPCKHAGVHVCVCFVGFFFKSHLLRILNLGGGGQKEPLSLQVLDLKH